MVCTDGIICYLGFIIVGSYYLLNILVNVVLLLLSAIVKAKVTSHTRYSLYGKVDFCLQFTHII